MCREKRRKVSQAIVFPSVYIKKIKYFCDIFDAVKLANDVDNLTKFQRDQSNAIPVKTGIYLILIPLKSGKLP